MTATKRKYLLGSLLILGFIALAVYFGYSDLWISQQVVDQGNSFAQAMEIAGLLVAPCLAILSGLTLFIYAFKTPQAKRRGLELAIGLLFLAGGLGYGGYVYFKMPPVLLCILSLLTAAAVIFSGWRLLHTEPEKLYQLMRIAVTSLIYLAAVLLLISLLKTLWGRVRYRDLADISEFTRWYLPQGLTGNYSFPSGHTGNAATLYSLVLLTPLFSERWKKALCYLVPILWILVMAVSRVIAGAHYASDVLFGAGLSIALFYLIRHYRQRSGEK